MARGGPRPGSGRKRGFKMPKTLEKEAARELLRQIVTRDLQALLTAQLAHAKGIGHLFTRDDKGKYSRVENEQKALDLLAGGTEGRDFYIFMKDPSVAAFTDLLNRALDKPKEPEQHLTVDGTLEIRVQKPWSVAELSPVREN